MEDYGRQVDPYLVIRERAQALVQRARQFGWSGPPFDPKELASLLGIRLRPASLAPGHDAFIVPRQDRRLEIIFNQAQPLTRQNFSISHDICHTLFPDAYDVVQNRYQRRGPFDHDRELEQLCDLGAAEILLPEEEFRADLAQWGLGLSNVPILRDRYQASREAIIRRMVALDRGESAAVFLEYRLKPSEWTAAKQLPLFGSTVQPRPKLRIAYSVASDRFPVFLPRDKSVPDSSCVYRSLAIDEVTSSFETWDIRGLPSCRVEAVRLASGDHPYARVRVVALLRV